MKMLIVEDEYPSAIRLAKLISQISETAEIVAIMESVVDSIEYINRHSDINLIFLDVHLTDGLGFEILDAIPKSIPCIITTAYDQYAIDAFRYLSIDYLLKPIKRIDLQKSLTKYNDVFVIPDKLLSSNQIKSLLSEKIYPELLICHRGKNRYPIKTHEIAYFFAEDREVWVVTSSGKEFYILKTLEGLESILNPKSFFRANRKVICNKEAIEKFEILPKSKINLILKPRPSFEVTISSEKSARFKEWL